MDPIELARSLPKSQRALIYANALLRLVLPRMPWPVWLALCGFASCSAMVLTRSLLAPHLAALSALETLAIFGLMIPALALDGLARKIPNAGRSRLGYLCIPFIVFTFYFAWTSQAVEPWAKAESKLVAAKIAAVSNTENLVLVEELLDSQRAIGRVRISEGLKIGLSKLHRPIEQPKPTALPPIPLPAGAVSPSAQPQPTVVDITDIETFDMAARAAMGIAEMQISSAGLKLKQTVAEMEKQNFLLNQPASLSTQLTAPQNRILFLAASIAWLGAPLGALLFGYGLLASFCLPFLMLGRALKSAGKQTRTVVRAGFSKILAPGPEELAELHRRVEAYKSVQDSFANESAKDPMIESSPPSFDDLAVTFELSNASRSAREENLEQTSLASTN